MPRYVQRLGAVAAVLAAMAGWIAALALTEAQTGGTVLAINPNGEPKGFHAGETVRYAIWHSKQKHGWRLRTTTAKHEHRFKGHIHVEGGIFEKIHSHDLEKEGKLRDWWKVGPKRHELSFEFKTDRGIDGINFHVSKSATALHFNLHIDGKAAHQRVYIGRDGQHPPHHEFNLPAHPG